MRGLLSDLGNTLLSTQAPLEAQEPNTLLIEDPTLYHGFVQLPKLVLYARNLSRDAKLLYAVLLGYAWQEQRCFPGYQRLCNDMDASENMVRKYMRELEAAHLLSQRRRGQGRTNIYLLHDLRTSKIEVQDHHKIAVLEPQESKDYEETEKKEIVKEQSGVRNSKGPSKPNKGPRNERLFTQAPVVSTAKDKVFKSLTGRRTGDYTVSKEPYAASHQEANGKAKGQRNNGTAQAHQLAGKRKRVPDWLSGYIVDFSREFHDEEATPSNITRAVHLFDRADVNAEVFIEQLYEARKITTGRANIQKRSEVGKNPAWPAGFPNRMPYFFRVLEEKLGLSGKISSETEDEQASGGLSKASAAEAFGVEETVDGDGIARPLAKAGLAEGAAIEDGGSGSGQEGSLATAHRDSPAVPKPVSSLPEEVEVAEAARVSIWRDYLPDPQDSQPRAVLMLWGFVRDAIRDRLNTARRSQLDALLPKWDASRPRTLLLLCQTACTAIVAELHLRREIEPQLGKLLSRFFDEIQVVYAPWREEN